ncbi:peptide chain release factor-like protein, partial [Staphylococcus epidermidis]|uniref:peptide chain release factor-like protein n=1 Tax=Staphylococcus epidermidis TaxID=1282 RepID=UPI0028CB81D7
ARRHINKADSPITIAHHPTAILLNNQNQQSQIKNTQAAIKIFNSKLYQLNLQHQHQQIPQIPPQQKHIPSPTQ